jgi:hypothetical protein
LTGRCWKFRREKVSNHRKGFIRSFPKERKIGKDGAKERRKIIFSKIEERGRGR